MSQISQDSLNSNTLQSGFGAPLHLAPIGTIYTNKENATVYINKDGNSLWEYLSSSGSTGSGSSSGVNITAFTYTSSANTFSISSSASTLSATLQSVSGLTVNGNLNVTGTTTTSSMVSNSGAAGGNMYGSWIISGGGNLEISTGAALLQNFLTLTHVAVSPVNKYSLALDENYGFYIRNITSGTTDLTILSGNVGIGVAVPTSNLSVSGTVSTSGNTKLANDSSTIRRVLIGRTPTVGSYTGGGIPDGLTINSDSGGIAFLRPSDYAMMNAMSSPTSGVLRIGGGNQSAIDVYVHTNFVGRFLNNPSRFGIATSTAAVTLDVSGDTRIVSGLTANTVVVSGLTSKISDNFLVTADSNGLLNRLTGNTANRVPYFNSSSAITTDSNFTYDGNGTFRLNNDITAQLLFNGNRGGILCNGGPTVNLTFEVSVGQTGGTDTTKGFLFRNRPANNYLLLNSPSTTQNRATFYGGVVLAPTANTVANYWGSSGVGLQIANNTYGDSSSSSSAGDLVINSFGVPTITAGTSTTYDALSTVYIAGPPTLGTNVSGTRYALKVNSGDSLFNGTVTITGGTPSISLTNPTQQQIKFFAGGTGVPQLSTYSAGAKIILSDNIDASISTGFAIGVDSGTLWYGADLAGNGHDWYAGTRQLARLIGSGGFQLYGLGGPTTAAMQISGTSATTGSKGGLGYMDFLHVINNYSAATNPNKWFRTSSGGTLEIVNSAYSALIFSLTEAGVLSTPGGGTSDIRVKNNVEYISGDVSSIISKLKPVKFEFNQYAGIKRHGFIAQDVLSVEPELVLGNGNETGGVYGLDYDGILALSIKSLQEALSRIDNLEKEIKELKGV